MSKLPEKWWLQYLGKPWEAVPNPPESYNCGELVRGIHHDFFGIETVAIPVTTAASRLQCLKAMQPELFGLEPVTRDFVKEFDVAFLGQRTRLSHCGIAVDTSEGMKILHCPEAGCGVCLDSLLELRMMGFSQVKWFRHKGLGE